MTEVIATLAVVGIGALLALPTLPALGRWGYAAVMVPVGFAGYLAAGVALVTAGRFSSSSALLLAAGAGVVTAVAWWLGSAVSRTLRWTDVAAALAVVAGAAVLVSLAAQGLHLTRLTPDSLEYLGMGGAIERAGSLDAIRPSHVLTRPIAIAMLHSPGFDGPGYMATWTPLIGGAGLALTAWLGHRALRIADAPVRWAVWILAAALVFLVTTNRVLYHSFYVNGHMAFATFLVLGAGGAWYACATRRWMALLPAAAGFAMLPVLRPEGVIVAILFLVPVVINDRVPMRWRWALVAPMVGVAATWHGVAVPPQVSADHLGVTGSVIGNVIAAGGLMMMVAATGIDRLRRLTTWAPAAITIGLGAFVALEAWRDFPSLKLALSATGTNLAYDGLWGAFWYVAPVLFVVAAVVVRFPEQRSLLYPLAAWPLAFLAFTYLREQEGYRVGAGDSGNRMMMHIVFVLVLYLVAATGVGARLADPKPTTRDAADANLRL